MNENLQRQQIEHNSYLIKGVRLNLVGDCAQEVKTFILLEKKLSLLFSTFGINLLLECTA